MNAPLNFWATNALTDQPLRAFITVSASCRYQATLILGAGTTDHSCGGPEMRFWTDLPQDRFPTGADFTADFTARRFPISDFRFADYRARDPLENPMEIWSGDFDF